MSRFPEGQENFIPAQTAKEFSGQMLEKGYALDFSLNSLKNEIDKIIESPDIKLDGADPDAWRIQYSLEAYIGHTLALLFNGVWKGEFCKDNPGVNFYTSYVEFGKYLYYPSHFIGYRISNGPKEGLFKDYLERVLPKIKERIENS